MQLQNAWVGGGGPAARRPGRPPGGAEPEPVTRRRDDRLRRSDWKDGSIASTTSSSILTQADGRSAPSPANGDVPKVEVNDPLAGHTELLSVKLHRQGHPRRDRLSGDTEMTTHEPQQTYAGGVARSPALVSLAVRSGARRWTGAGGLDPATILKPLADSWPTYSGDYTGRRYSALTQVNQTTVKNLTLAGRRPLNALGARRGRRRRRRRIRRGLAAAAR